MMQVDDTNKILHSYLIRKNVSLWILIFAFLFSVFFLCYNIKKEVHSYASGFLIGKLLSSDTKEFFEFKQSNLNIKTSNFDIDIKIDSTTGENENMNYLNGDYNFYDVDAKLLGKDVKVNGMFSKITFRNVSQTVDMIPSGLIDVQNGEKKYLLGFLIAKFNLNNNVLDGEMLSGSNELYYVSSDFFKIFLYENRTELSGNVVFESDDFKASSDFADVSLEDKVPSFAHLEGNVTFFDKNGKNIAKAKYLDLDLKNMKVFSKSNIILKGDGASIFATGIEYDSKTGFGKLNTNASGRVKVTL